MWIKRNARSKYTRLIFSAILPIVLFSILSSPLPANGEAAVWDYKTERLSLVINAEKKDSVWVVRTQYDVFMKEKDLKGFGLLPAGIKTIKGITVKGVTYIALGPLSPAVKFGLNENEGALYITALPGMIAAEVVEPEGEEPKPKETPAVRYKRFGVALFVDAEKKGDVSALRTRYDVLVKEKDLDDSGILTAGIKTIKKIAVKGITYVALGSLSPKIKFKLKEKERILEITAAPEMLEKKVEKYAVKGYETLPLTLFINGEEMGDIFIVRTAYDVFIREEDLKDLRIPLADVEVVKKTVIEGDRYASLGSLSPKIKFELDEDALALRITAKPKMFEGEKIHLARKAPLGIEYPRHNSAFLNYSLDYTKDDLGYTVAAPFEAGIRFREYLMFSNFSYTKAEDEDGEFVRLFSNVTRDDRKRLRRYIAGDFNASTGELGGGMTMGGLNISKNFGLDPYFLRYPGIDLSALLYTTSDVELWADGTLLRKETLPPGIFEFKDIPATAGVGEIQLIIKDAFGREQRFFVPIYFSSVVLKKGVHEYNYSAGFLREGFGTEDSEYGKPAILFIHRHGISDWFTAGIRGEANDDVISAGLLSNFVLEPIGFFDAAIAGSKARDDRDGYAGSLGYSINLKKIGLNFRLTLRGHSRQYANLSLSPDKDRARTDIITSVSYGGKRLGSISITYANTDKYASEDTEKYTARYSRSLFRGLSMNVSAGKTITDDTETVDEIIATLTYSFGWNTTGNFTYQTSDGIDKVTATVQRTPPGYKGFGFRLYEEDQDDAPRVVESEVSYRGAYGVYSGKARSSDGADTYNIKASGSLASVGGSIHFGQPVNDSFAIIKIGNLKGVPVYSSNMLINETDFRGEVMASNIRSYSDNEIFVKDKDLPSDYTMDSFSSRMAPLYRSGTYVRFEPKKMRAIAGKIYVVEKGKKIPAEFWQLIITIDGEDIGSPIVTDGEFYLENVPSGRYKAVIQKEDMECRFDIFIPESEKPLIEMDEIVCGVK